MRKGIKLCVVVMLIEVIMLCTQFTPSLQQSVSVVPPECWTRMMNCHSKATSLSDSLSCCLLMAQILDFERSCFCFIRPAVVSDPVHAAEMANLLALCSIPATFEQLCPGPSSSSPSGPLSPMPSGGQHQLQEVPLCLQNINNCIESNWIRGIHDPRFNVLSPLFNAAEFMCCSLVHQTAQTDKDCFCTINALIQADPLLAPSALEVLSTCGIAHSVPSLDTFCQG